jgi:TRAP-type mannitol/chloroaromatic compound transport system substrate-binding protein
MMKKICILSLLVLILTITGLAACNTASNAPLPHSMKGYELYSWQEGGQWRFTLITGTNRNKNLEEITSGEQKTGEAGWVNLRVAGVEELKALLDRIPAGEWVAWSGGDVIVKEGSVNPLALPPVEIINQVKQRAEQRGLEFQIANNY